MSNSQHQESCFLFSNVTVVDLRLGLIPCKSREMLLEKTDDDCYLSSLSKNLSGQFGHVQEDFQENHDMNLVNCVEKE